MPIKTATFRNIRLITELTLEFDPAVTVLHGRTGTGKTTVLDSLAVGLAAVQRKGRSFQSRDLRENGREPDVLINTVAGSQWLRRGLDPTRTVIDDIKAADAGTAVIALSGVHFNTFKPHRVHGSSSQPDLVGQRAARAILNRESPAPVSDDPSRWSHGQAKIMAIMTSVARTLCLASRNTSELWQESPGILLIDDIDALLHPGLHQRIIPAIRTTFPNVQVIASTNSPLILTTVHPHQIIQLQYEQPKITATIGSTPKPPPNR